MQNIKLAQMKVLDREDDEARNRSLELLERVGLADQRDKFAA